MATEKQLIHRLILLQLCIFTRCRWRLKIRSQGDTSSLFDVWRLFVLLADVCRLDGRPSRPAVHPCNPRRVLVRYQNHLSWFPLIGGAPPSVLRPHSLQRKPSCRFTITDRSKANNQDNAFCCDHLQHHQTSPTFIFFLPSLDVIRCLSRWRPIYNASGSHVLRAIIHDDHRRVVIQQLISGVAYKDLKHLKAQKLQHYPADWSVVSSNRYSDTRDEPGLVLHYVFIADIFSPPFFSCCLYTCQDWVERLYCSTVSRIMHVNTGGGNPQDLFFFKIETSPMTLIVTLKMFSSRAVVLFFCFISAAVYTCLDRRTEVVGELYTLSPCHTRQHKL